MLNRIVPNLVMMFFEAVGAGVLGVFMVMLLTQPLNSLLEPMGLSESGTVAAVISFFVGAAIAVPLIGRVFNENGKWWMALVGALIGMLIALGMWGLAHLFASRILAIVAVVMLFGLPALLAAAAYTGSVRSKSP